MSVNMCVNICIMCINTLNMSVNIIHVCTNVCKHMQSEITLDSREVYTTNQSTVK
jgi:hypothetical protein